MWYQHLFAFNIPHFLLLFCIEQFCLLGFQLLGFCFVLFCVLVVVVQMLGYFSSVLQTQQFFKTVCIIHDLLGLQQKGSFRKSGLPFCWSHHNVLNVWSLFSQDFIAIIFIKLYLLSSSVTSRLLNPIIRPPPFSSNWMTTLTGLYITCWTTGLWIAWFSNTHLLY